MSKLTKEQFDKLPEDVQEHYEKDGDGYVHKGLKKVKSTADDLDRQRKEAERLAKEHEDKLREISAKEQERIAEAERKAYEKARKEGNLDEVERKWQEKYDHLAQQHSETERQYQDRIKRMAERQKNAIAGRLASYATSEGRAAFSALIVRYIEVDPETGQETFLDDAGRATSLDEKGFIEWAKTQAMFKPLIKAETNAYGGGYGSGGSGGGAPTKKFHDHTERELVELRRNNTDEYDRLKKLSKRQ